eukprot:3368948-Amphidinium_carterae.4
MSIVTLVRPIAEIGRLMAHRLQAHGGFNVFTGHDPAEVAQAHLLHAEGCSSSVLEDVLQAVLQSKPRAITTLRSLHDSELP